MVVHDHCDRVGELTFRWYPNGYARGAGSRHEGAQAPTLVVRIEMEVWTEVGTEVEIGGIGSSESGKLVFLSLFSG